MTPTPRPKKIHEDCQHPQEIGWVQGARRLVVALLVVLIGSLGGIGYAIVDIAAGAAELRADLRHLAERQAEFRTQMRELDGVDQRIERESSTASQQVLVQLGSLRAEVQAIGQRLDRLEQSRARR